MAVLATAFLCAAVPVASASHSSGPGRHLATLNGHTQPTIWFVDYTDTTWPVTAAADEWNRSSKLTVGRRSSCPDANDYCPTVSQLYTTAWYGRTTYQLNAAGSHISRSNFYIELSTYAALGNRRSVACHELGHALGLAHRLPSDSCMRADNVFPQLPDTHDFDQLWFTYNHSD